MREKWSSKQQTKFSEERSRLILAYVYPEKYSDAVLGESPDIQNPIASVGVEVTSGMRPDIQEGVSRALSITGKTASEFTKHDIANIEQNRVISIQMPNGMYVAATKSYWGNNFAYKECIEKKIVVTKSMYGSTVEVKG